ncbi:hypothetical protein QBC43DRAFT_223918, partial [Cladorrhinum sp. PSN259]
PRNYADGLFIIIRKCASISTIYNRLNLLNLASSRIPSKILTLRFLPTTAPPSSALNPKNRCYCRLTLRNLSRFAAIPDIPCYNSRAYIISVIYIL